MKTKNDSMGVLKLKLDVTPENIECLKSLFLKPENKISNVIKSGTMLFNGKPVEDSIRDLPTVATLRTKFGELRDGDIVIAKSGDKSAYIGTVARFTTGTIYTKNTYNFYISSVDDSPTLSIQHVGAYCFNLEELAGITKNQ